MGALLVALVLAQADGGVAGAERLDGVRLFFMAGDLAKAEQLARGCAREGVGACRPMVKWLAGYARLARHLDELALDGAREILDLDGKISPLAKGKITRGVFERFVVFPLELARSHAAQGDPERARVIAREVLRVDPSNAEAQRLVDSRDGG